MSWFAQKQNRTDDTENKGVNGGTLNLRYLQLKTQQVPSLLTDLRNLTSVNLSNNDLATFPPELTSVKTLRAIFINKNKLIGLPDLSKLVALEVFTASHNKLSTDGIESAKFNKLDNIKVLTLSHNNITTFPQSIGKCQSLQKLALSYNPVASIPDVVKQLTALEWFGLSHTALEEVNPLVYRLPNLKGLAIDGNSKLKSISSMQKRPNFLLCVSSEFAKVDQKARVEAVATTYFRLEKKKETGGSQSNVTDSQKNLESTENVREEFIYELPNLHLRAGTGEYGTIRKRHSDGFSDVGSVADSDASRSPLSGHTRDEASPNVDPTPRHMLVQQLQQTMKTSLETTGTSSNSIKKISNPSLSSSQPELTTPEPTADEKLARIMKSALNTAQMQQNSLISELRQKNNDMSVARGMLKSTTGNNSAGELMTKQQLKPVQQPKAEENEVSVERNSSSVSINKNRFERTNSSKQQQQNQQQPKVESNEAGGEGIVRSSSSVSMNRSKFEGLTNKQPSKTDTTEEGIERSASSVSLNRSKFEQSAGSLPNRIQVSKSPLGKASQINQPPSPVSPKFSTSRENNAITDYEGRDILDEKDIVASYYSTGSNAHQNNRKASIPNSRRASISNQPGRRVSITSIDQANVSMSKVNSESTGKPFGMQSISTAQSSAFITESKSSSPTTPTMSKASWSNKVNLQKSASFLTEEEKIFQGIRIPESCADCSKKIVDDVCVLAVDKLWHPECFKCSTCREKLKEDYFEFGDKVYCEEHFYNTRNFHCCKCSLLIRGPFVEYNEKRYHPDHFVCWKCECDLAGGDLEFMEVTFGNSGEGEKSSDVVPLCLGCCSDMRVFSTD